MLMRSLTLVLLLGIFLVISPSACAQFRVQGQVRDSVTGAPLPFAAYLVKGSLTGGLTDQFGRFSFTVKEIPLTLVVQLLGYRPQEILIRDTLPVFVRLSPRAQQLREVVVSADPVRVLREKDAWHFFDYCFYDDFLVALAGKRSSRPYLLLLGAEGETLAAIPAPLGAESLRTDCLGAVQVLSRDSVYQLYYDYTRLQLPYRSLRSEWERTMVPCKCQIEDYYYFGWPAYRGLRMDYYSINWYRKGEYQPLRSIADSIKIRGFQTNYDLSYFVAKKNQRPFPDPRYCVSHDYLVSHLDSFRLTEPLGENDARWLTPVETGLYRLGKELILVNPVDSVFERYDKEGHWLGIFRLDAGRNKGMRFDYLVDEVAQQFYAVGEQNGITHLLRIDTATGHASREFVVKGKPYITRPQVRDGVLYFLYRKAEDDAPRKLHRMYLD